MKKCLLLVLALAALCMLFSCGGGELQELSDKLRKSEPEAIVSTMTVITSDGTELPAMTATTSEGKKNPAALDLVYYPTFSFDDQGNAVIPSDTTAPITGSATAEDEVTLSDLRFNKKFFKDEAYLLEENRFYAIISDVPGFFGTEIDGVDEVSFTIDFDIGYPVKITVSYTTANNTGVSIVMRVKY